MKDLRSKGYYCIRAYLSRGTFDVIAVKHGYAYMLQAKTGKHISSTEWNEVYKEAMLVGGVPIYIHREPNKQKRYYIIQGRRKNNMRQRDWPMVEWNPE